MSYADKRRDVAVANEYLSEVMPCNRCRAQAERETLVNYGGMCGACYGRYVAEANSKNPPRTAEQRREVLRRAVSAFSGGVSRAQAAEVAKRLRILEASGMKLTGSQRWVLERCELKTGTA